MTVRGTPIEMGRQHGEALRETIRRFIPMRFDAVRQYMAEAGRGSVADLLAVGRKSYQISLQWDPIGMEELAGVADGAGVDSLELFTAANMTDMRDAVILADGPDSEGCSAILLPPELSRSAEILVGQTWDLNPQDIDYVVAVHRLPAEGPETWSVTVSGCPSLVGMNEYGLTVGTTNVKTWGSRPGVGYLNVLHKALAQPGWNAAAQVIVTAPRAGAHTYWAADASRAVLWSTTPDDVQSRDLSGGFVAQTNHCQVPSHAAIEWQPPSSSSLARLARLEQRLSRGGHDVHTLRTLFGDRTDGIDSLNRYPEDAQGTATNSVAIGIPARCEFWACRGPADRGTWVQLPFSRGGQGAAQDQI